MLFLNDTVWASYVDRPALQNAHLLANFADMYMAMHICCLKRCVQQSKVEASFCILLSALAPIFAVSNTDHGMVTASTAVVSVAVCNHYCKHSQPKQIRHHVAA